MTNSFFLAGELFELTSLEPRLDQAFVDLHAAILGAGSYSWFQFKSCARVFFSQNKLAPEKQDEFFSNFTILWRRFLVTGHYDRAESIWRMAVEIALDWEAENQDQRVHKGTPYYFWGTTAILRGDIDRGYALMHQALEEDVRSSGSQYPDTPALALATLNATKGEQAFRMWVLEKAGLLNTYLENYCAGNGCHLTYETLNQKYFQNAPSRHAVYSLSYVVARLAKLRAAPPYVLDNDLVAQVNLDLLFRLTLVIDASIKQHNASQWKFVQHMEFLSRRASLSLNLGDLAYANDQAQSNFATTITSLVDGNYKWQTGPSAIGLARDLAVAYLIRNYGAHNVGPLGIVRHRAVVLQQAVFNVFFLAVEQLY